MKRKYMMYLLAGLAWLGIASCESDLVESPTISEFSVALYQQGETTPLASGDEIFNGDTLVFTVDAMADYLTLNTPLTAINLTDAMDQMPYEEQYTFLNDTLTGQTVTYTLELVATNTYDQDNIKRTVEEFSVAVKDTLN